MSENTEVEMATNLQRLFGMTDLVTPMAVRVTASLHLVDHITQGADTVNKLAAVTGIDPRRLELIVGLITQQQLLEISEDGVLSVTPMGALLRSGPGSFQRMLDLRGMSGKYDTAVFAMLETIASGTNAFEQVHGLTYWQDLAGNTDAVRELNAMEPSSPSFDAKLLSTGHDWSTVSTVLDVGGSNGSILSQLLTDHPHLRGAVLDLPERIERAEDVFAEHGVTDRAEAVGGDFFTEIPNGYGTYLLSAILADWDDDRARAILTNVRHAMPESGRVIISEIRMQPPHLDRDYQLALRMLCGTGGLERTSGEVAELARVAGLTPAGDPISTGQRTVQVFAPA